MILGLGQQKLLPAEPRSEFSKKLAEPNKLIRHQQAAAKLFNEHGKKTETSSSSLERTAGHYRASGTRATLSLSDHRITSTHAC
jgi:hypothetical protein